MYISTKDWKNYIDKLSKLNNTAGRLMSEYVARNGFANTDAILDYAYGLVTKYGEGSAALSAEMYDAIAEMSGRIVPSAEVAPTADYGEVAKAIQGTIKRSKNPNTTGSTVGRLVKQAGADTMLKNAARDGAQFAWVPMGDTCAFCITLASRGFQYMSAKALRNGHAEHIHANCDCNYVVRFDDHSGVKGYDPDKYLEMYENAEGGNSKEKINTLRRIQYAERKDVINAQKREAYARKTLDNAGNSGIIKSRGVEMLRKEDENKIEPMPKKQFHRIVKGFKKQGGEIRTDEEAQRYLDLKGAEGVTINSKLIFLRKNPSRSAVFEELIHTTQFKNGEINEIPRDVIVGEINAKEKLLRYAEQYNLTQKEIDNTKKMLSDYKEELKRLDGAKDGI